MKRKISKFTVAVTALAICGVGLLAWDLSAPEVYVHEKSNIPFDHEKHGENIGLDCSKCHPGAYAGMRATFPSKQDCLDCHNLPLTDTPENAKLEKALADAPDAPFEFISLLPQNVVFSHGLHAGTVEISCETCHGSAKELATGKRPTIRMHDCLACHSGKRGDYKAPTDCARCHR